MSTDKEAVTNPDRKSPDVSPGNYSPVNVYMEDSVGAIFLGLLCGILLIGWMRAEARYCALLNERK